MTLEKFFRAKLEVVKIIFAEPLRQPKRLHLAFYGLTKLKKDFQAFKVAEQQTEEPGAGVGASSSRAIVFLLPDDLSSGLAQLQLFDVAGRRIARAEVLVTTGLNRIPLSTALEGAHPPRSGVYLARLEVAGRSWVRRMAFVPDAEVKP